MNDELGVLVITVCFLVSAIQSEHMITSLINKVRNKGESHE